MIRIRSILMLVEFVNLEIGIVLKGLYTLQNETR